MLVFGLLGFFMEENDIPIAPCILGIVLGGMLEANFVTSMIKSDGDLFAFFERPIAAGLGIFTILVWAVAADPAFLAPQARVDPPSRVR